MLTTNGVLCIFWLLWLRSTRLSVKLASYLIIILTLVNAPNCWSSSLLTIPMISHDISITSSSYLSSYHPSSFSFLSSFSPYHFRQQNRYPRPWESVSLQS